MPVHKKVIHKISVNFTVPEAESSIIVCSAILSYDSIENLKNKLENMKISDFPGENMFRYQSHL